MTVTPKDKLDQIKAWTDANKDRVRENKRRHYLSNRETYKARAKQWREANPDQARSNDLKKKYGITLADKAAMFAAQNGKCAGCSTDIELYSSHTDHDHSTGKVRGLLCAFCNLTLGSSRESISRLEGLAAYLRQHGAL